ncbi:MAG: PilZ domain-containing protein [Planctomycetota bacterium]
MNHARPDRTEATDHRAEPRLPLPAMYCELRARAGAQRPYELTGHIYDLSLSGLRFELDEALPAGASMDVRITLPGAEPVTVKASASVVRQASEQDEPGPCRLAATFTRFRTPMDRERLSGYLVPRLAQMREQAAEQANKAPVRKAA